MGIPTFFRSILRENPKCIQGAIPGVLDVDYFFIDFNSLIYMTWANLSKKEGTLQEIQDRLTKETVDKVVDLVSRVVRPREYVYLSVDGSAPRAKVVQQRSRRFKSVQVMGLLHQARQRLGLSEETTICFDPSSHICPGTPFMWKLNEALRGAMRSKRFGDCTVYLNGVDVPGEGEHKFLPRLRALATNPETKEKTTVVYSPDGDMISLSLLTHKSHLYILRAVDPLSENEKSLAENGHTLLYCSLDKVRSMFHQQMTKTYTTGIDSSRVLLDYNMLLAMVGNDFVASLPFLKIRAGGLNLLLSLYNELASAKKEGSYLVCQERGFEDTFFLELFQQLAAQEEREMKTMFYSLRRGLDGSRIDTRRQDMEANMTPIQLYESRLLHLSFFHPEHPLFPVYGHLWKKIDYSQPTKEWKRQYYTYFGIKEVDAMIHNYLESLQFTLLYYTKGCPSWQWYYRYRVAPLPSDVVEYIKRHPTVFSSIRFVQGEPLTPFQQLAVILPQSMNRILPPPIQGVVSSPTWRPYFPDRFYVDALAGFKYIYSEAILPEWEEEKEKEFLRDIRIAEDRLQPKDRLRNTIKTGITKYVPSQK